MKTLPLRAWVSANVAVVLGATLAKPVLRVGSFWSASITKAHRSIELIPFSSWVHAQVWYGPLLDTAANLALFAPLGVCARRAGWTVRKTVAVAAGGSLAIEVLQYLLAVGFSDVMDVACNSLGAWLGWRYGKHARAERAMGAWLLLVAAVVAYGLVFAYVF